jgi:hypothetical protein
MRGMKLVARVKKKVRLDRFGNRFELNFESADIRKLSMG